MADFAKLVLDADTRGLKKGEQDLKGLGRQAGATAKEVDRSSSTMASAVKRFAVVAAGALSVGELVRFADTYSQMNSQLRLVTNSTAELISVEKQLFTIAQQNRVGFESTVDLYARIARSTQSLGVSQAEVLQVTDTINKALIISGTSAQQASGALMQLGQAFASGALRGDELNSILEGMPRVAQAIAEGMGITVGQLREMGAQGLLTSEQVFNALLKMSGDVESEFAKMPPTVGQAFTTLGNSALKMVGEFDRASNASGGLANMIIGLSSALDNAAPFAAALGGGIRELANRFNELIGAANGGLSPALTEADNRIRGLIRTAGAASGPIGALIGQIASLGVRAESTGPMAVNANAMLKMGQEALKSANAAKTLAAATGSVVAPVTAMTGAVDQASASAKAANDNFANLYDRLFPYQAASRKFAEEMELIQRSRLSLAEKENAIARLESESFRERTRNLGSATVSRGLLNQGSLMTAVDTTLTVEQVRAQVRAEEIIRTTGDYAAAMKVIQDASERGARAVGDSFGTMADRALQALDRMVGAIRGGGFFDILNSVIGVGLQLGGMGVFGKGVQTSIRAQSFDGGGFTGSGARSGGVDGKGGFMAVLHPNETVIDHTKGQGQRQSVVIINNSALAEAFVDERIVGAAPAIMQGSAQIAQSQASRAARRRVA